MMTDPIADMLTRVRNAQAASKVDVAMPSSKLKLSIAKVLQDEGYIAGYSSDNAVKPTLTVASPSTNPSAGDISQNGKCSSMNDRAMPTFFQSA